MQVYHESNSSSNVDRLRAASQAVDFAPLSNDNGDRDGNPRNRDLVRVPDRFGPRDLGAYERQNTEPLVLNGGFDEDLNLWSTVTPQGASHEAIGANGTPGAVLVDDDDNPALGEVVGLRQCVPLPGPGPFALTGRAYGDGLGQLRAQDGRHTPEAERGVHADEQHDEGRQSEPTLDDPREHGSFPDARIRQRDGAGFGLLSISVSGYRQ